MINRYDNKAIFCDLETFGGQFAAGIIRVALDPSFTILYANNVFYERLNYSRELFQEVYKNSFRQIMIEEDVQIFYEKMKSPNEKGEVTVYVSLRQDHNKKYDYMIQGKLSDECYQEKYCIMNCIIVDITEFILAQKKLEAETERYRIISEISNDITFEYDFEKDIIYFSEKFMTVFHEDNIIHDFRINKAVKKAIHSNDIDEFNTIFEYDIHDNKSKYRELRIKIDHQEYNWFWIQYTATLNEHGRVKKLLGKITNIDKEKKELEDLIQKSQIDTMTNLLNKKTIELKVKQYLRKMPFNKSGALIIVDVDDFKNVNDSSGHLMGDQILIEIADIMRRIFRSSDLIGRIGGDEFLIFMKDITDEKQVEDKLQRLCEEICNSNLKPPMAMLDKDWNGSISVSVGASLQRLRKYSFRDLFLQADQALYCSKDKGKNQYTIFHL